MSTAETLPPAVVLGLSPTGLHVVRALGSAGVEVHGVAEGRQVGAFSRYLTSVIDQADGQHLLEELVALARSSTARPVLIPTSDQHIEFLMRHAEMLAGHFTFQPSYADGIAGKVMVKESFYALCEQHGVNYPRLVSSDAAGLVQATQALHFPLMVKPSEIHLAKEEMRGSKGWIVRDAEELAAIVPDIPAAVGTLLAQEIVPGPESEITLCCAWMDGEGQAHQAFTARKLRQYPPGFGSASLVQSHDEPQSLAIFTRLLAAIGYRGIAAGEFKRHPETGELSIIEINVRPSLWFSVSQAAGRPVVLDAYRNMAGLAPLTARPQRHGVRWRYALKDLASALFYRRRGNFILPPPEIDVCGKATAMVYPVHQADDPRPARREVWLLARKAFDRLRPRVLGQGRS